MRKGRCWTLRRFVKGFTRPPIRRIVGGLSCMSETIQFFRKYFPLLAHGNQPYFWQTALFERLINDDWPDSVALPTGAGKTSILQVWLLALAWTALPELPPNSVSRTRSAKRRSSWRESPGPPRQT